MSTNRTEGISLDALSVRGEIADAPADSYDLSPEALTAIDELSDEEINAIVLDTVDDAFFEAYDAAREKVITRIITQVTGG